MLWYALDLRPVTAEGQHEPRFTDYRSYSKYYYNPCATFSYPPSDYGMHKDYNSICCTNDSQ